MASLVSGNVAVRYDEASGVVGAGALVLAPAARLASQTAAGPNMDAAEPGPGSAAGVTLVKAEITDHLAGTSAATSTPATTPASPAPSALSPGLFTASSNKRPRTDDWLSPTSPASPHSQQHLVYSTPQQQINSQQPPLAHSTPLGQTQQAQQPPNNNGYASPMSSGSYDPYSPNGKIGKFSHQFSTNLSNLSRKTSKFARFFSPNGLIAAQRC